MGRYCEFCMQAYEEGYFWKHIGDQHPISCSNVHNSYTQYKGNALNDDEMYTRIAYHLFHCPSCKTLVVVNHHEPVSMAKAKTADYYLAIMVGKTVAEFKSGWNASYEEILRDMDAQEEVGQEAYDELKKFLEQLNLLAQDASGFKNIICVEDVPVGSEEYGLGARLRVEIVCPEEEPRGLIFLLFGTALTLWYTTRNLEPNRSCVGMLKDTFPLDVREQEYVGYIGFSKKMSWLE